MQFDTDWRTGLVTLFLITLLILDVGAAWSLASGARDTYHYQGEITLSGVEAANLILSHPGDVTYQQTEGDQFLVKYSFKSNVPHEFGLESRVDKAPRLPLLWLGLLSIAILWAIALEVDLRRVNAECS